MDYSVDFAYVCLLRNLVEVARQIESHALAFPVIVLSRQAAVEYHLSVKWIHIPGGQGGGVR